MTAVDLATKRCCTCKDVKALSDFYRHRNRVDGHADNCKDCARAAVARSQAKRRAEIGDEAYRAEKREQVRRVREDPLRRSRDRANSDAYNTALYALRDAHRREFDALLARERYERGLDQ